MQRAREGERDRKDMKVKIKREIEKVKIEKGKNW